MIKKKYYKYHRLVSYLIEQCFVLKDKILCKIDSTRKYWPRRCNNSHFISRTSQLCGKEIKFANTIQFGSSDPIEVLNFIWSVPFQVPHSIQEPIMIGL